LLGKKDLVDVGFQMTCCLQRGQFLYLVSHIWMHS